MLTEYIHIRNAYVSTMNQGTQKSHALIIETDLPLPHRGEYNNDPRFDTLLTEIAVMKENCPALFAAVENVEIREAALEERAVDMPDMFADMPAAAYMLADKPLTYLTA